MTSPGLIDIAENFAELSLLAFGGGNALLPELHARLSERLHWLSSTDFAALFALAQAAPGPNIMVVPLIGKHVAGLGGFIVALVAFFLPSSVLLLLSMTIWERFRDSPWSARLRRALLPVTAGLVASGAMSIVVSADRNLFYVAITALSFVTIRFSRLHPLAVLAAGGVLGIAGLWWSA